MQQSAGNVPVSLPNADGIVVVHSVDELLGSVEATSAVLSKNLLDIRSACMDQLVESEQNLQRYFAVLGCATKKTTQSVEEATALMDVVGKDMVAIDAEMLRAHQLLEDIMAAHQAVGAIEARLSEMEAEVFPSEASAASQGARVGSAT
jgi:hypothetical protein